MLEKKSLKDFSFLPVSCRGYVVIGSGCVRGWFSAEIDTLDAYINVLALRAILNPDDWSAECQLSKLHRYLRRLH